MRRRGGWRSERRRGKRLKETEKKKKNKEGIKKKKEQRKGEERLLTVCYYSFWAPTTDNRVLNLRNPSSNDSYSKFSAAHCIIFS